MKSGQRLSSYFKLTKCHISALTAIFDEADVSNDGKISIQEYLTLCENYGIEVGTEPIFLSSTKSFSDV